MSDVNLLHNASEYRSCYDRATYYYQQGETEAAVIYSNECQEAIEECLRWRAASVVQVARDLSDAPDDGGWRTGMDEDDYRQLAAHLLLLGYTKGGAA